MRKIICIIVIPLYLIISCTDKSHDIIPVKSIDQIQGIWSWESGCGGITTGCIYPSIFNYAAIVFTSNGEYIEYHNDTIYMQTIYSIQKTDDTHGTLILGGSYYNSYYNPPIILSNNHLGIIWGELQNSYIKIK